MVWVDVHINNYLWSENINIKEGTTEKCRQSMVSVVFNVWIFVDCYCIWYRIRHYFMILTLFIMAIWINHVHSLEIAVFERCELDCFRCIFFIYHNCNLCSIYKKKRTALMKNLFLSSRVSNNKSLMKMFIFFFLGIASI